MQKTKTRKKPASRKSNHYIDKKELFKETVACLEKGVMSDKLARMLTKLVENYSKKYTFGSYTYNDDMQAHARMMLVRTWKAFNPEKSTNAFAFFTQCAKNSFIQILNQEKHQRNIRDKIVVHHGLNPSHTYAEVYKEEQQASSNRQFADDEEDYNTTVKQNKDLEQSIKKADELLEY